MMFAILAVSLVGGQFGACNGLPSSMSAYGISQSQVSHLSLFKCFILNSVSTWDMNGKFLM